jgi:hypothetical protein
LDGLRSVATLSNGRTYGVTARYHPNSSEIVELTRDGLRPTGTQLQLGLKLYADGSLRNQTVKSGTLNIYRRELTGFTASGNPEWRDPLPRAGIAAIKNEDPYYHDVPTVGGVNEASFPETHGVVVLFNPGLAQGFHLGGVRVGEQRWLWRASRSGTWSLDAHGQIAVSDGTYEVQRGVQYAGNAVLTAGPHIIFGYHGEAWNGGQADQWVHYLDNGLFVGQFGRPVYPAENKLSAQPGSAGNAFSPQLVEVNRQLYLWHNDESVHGGVHRWRIDGADQIKILQAPIEP